MNYTKNMLSGIRVFSSDIVWQKILSQLGALLVEEPIFADVDLDAMQIDMPISVMNLKSAIIAAQDNTKILNKIFGHNVSLSPLQTQIIVRLYKTGGMTADELKIALGYAPNAKTHTVDTAIYGLRKLYGHNFIKNDNGVFKIGGL